MTPHRHHIRHLVSWLLRLITCAALAIDAYVHADLAQRYDPNGLAALSQGELFRIEAGVSALAAAILLLTARRIVWAFAFVVAAAALAAVLIYRYVDIGALGPLPDMYEPIWYPEKTLTAFAEAAGTVAALVGFILSLRTSRRTPDRINTTTATGWREHRPSLSSPDHRKTPHPASRPDQPARRESDAEDRGPGTR